MIWHIESRLCSRNVTLADLGGNKLLQVGNIAQHVYLSCLRRVVNSTLDRSILGVVCKNRITEDVRFNVTHVNCVLVILSLAAIFYQPKS